MNKKNAASFPQVPSVASLFENIDHETSRLEAAAQPRHQQTKKPRHCRGVHTQHDSSSALLNVPWLSPLAASTQLNLLKVMLAEPV